MDATRAVAFGDLLRRYRLAAALTQAALAELTSFVGRERELAEVRRLLAATRLLTVTGAGGTGKTRLALHVASDLLGSCADGVWFVDLAPLSDPELVARTVASAAGVPGR